ncbi:MAG: STAS domain-containing protein [Lachnospiraceae bacterium]|nr:STAS domain-containing protein [Lachnospiraceae bacterium]
MTINKELDGTTLTVAVAGRLDTNTAPELEEELMNSLSDVKVLVLDFEGLEYISSAGLRILLSAHKIMSKQDGMKVRNVNQAIQDILDITGFTDILTIE